jgi:MFS family permease
MSSVGDRIGNRQVFIIGFVLLVVSLFGLMLARELWMLYLFAVVFGFPMGGMTPSESPLIAWLFGMRSHGLIYGMARLGFTVGAAIGPFMTGYIFDLNGSYQVAFLVCAAVSVAGLIFTVALRPTRRPAIEI